MKDDFPIIEGEFTEAAPPRRARWYQNPKFWIYMLVLAAIAGSINQRIVTEQPAAQTVTQAQDTGSSN